MKSNNLLKVTEASAKTCKSKSGFYAEVKAGTLPPPVKTGIRAVAWPEHELDAINTARIAGQSNEEIRQLVERMVEDRQKLRLVA